jgi:hypothetical protein
MTLRLTKIEAGINDGEVLYHAFVEKNLNEIAELRKKAPILRLLKKNFFFSKFSINSEN